MPELTRPAEPRPRTTLTQQFGLHSLKDTDFLSRVRNSVACALEEDIGSGDITAQLIPAGQRAQAVVISREEAVICGRPWADEVFSQLDSDVEIEWLVSEGERVAADQPLLRLRGATRSLLTGERCALNFIQTLSATATAASEYAALTAAAGIAVLDTRKTLPGLRYAQKYAVSVGGCYNHRIGLFDAFLIKENHITGCGSIAAAVAAARQQAPERMVEVEVETLEELDQAVAAGADRIMLDNFTQQQMAEISQRSLGSCEIEVSGNIEAAALSALADSCVHFVSSGALTKHIRAVDLSMRLEVLPERQ